MGIFRIFRNGIKIGEITLSESGCASGPMIILLIVIVFLCVQCSNSAKEREIMEDDTIRLIDLLSYSDEAKETVDCTDEYAWIEENCPEIVFSMFNDTTKGKGVYSSDDSFVYLEEYSIYHDDGGHSGGFFECKLSGDYTTFTGTVYLSRSFVEEWTDWKKEKADIEAQGKEMPYSCDDFGMCIIFVDNTVVYQSPVLHPDGTLSDQISLNVTGAEEIVICLAGGAYLGAPRVTK